MLQFLDVRPKLQAIMPELAGQMSQSSVVLVAFLARFRRVTDFLRVVETRVACNTWLES